MNKEGKNLSAIEIDKIIEQTNATLELEGLEVPEFTKQIYREYAKGKITESEALQKLKDYVMLDTEHHVVEYEELEERIGKPLTYVD